MLMSSSLVTRLLIDLPTMKDREGERYCQRPSSPMAQGNGADHPTRTSCFHPLAILKILLKNEQLAPDVDLAKLAKDTDTYSGSDLKRQSSALLTRFSVGTHCTNEKPLHLFSTRHRPLRQRGDGRIEGTRTTTLGTRSPQPRPRDRGRFVIVRLIRDQRVRWPTRWWRWLNGARNRGG